MDMTIKKALDRTANERPEQPALRFFRDGAWRTRSFGALRAGARRVAEMLAESGVAPGDRVALSGENAPEWYEAYHGIVGVGATAVPVDAKLPEQELAHVLRDAGVSVVFCSLDRAEMLAEMEALLPGLRLAIVSAEEGAELPPAGRVVFRDRATWEKAVSARAESPDRAFDRFGPEEETVASIIYTSGTTGRAKGAMLTHRNFMANVESVAKAIEVRRSDRFFLVLPLHHAFAFTTMLALPAYVGCEVAIGRSLRTIAPDMAAVEPTAFLAVPLLLEKMLARIEGEVRKRSAGRALMRMGLGRLAGRKVRAQLGGRLRLVVSGGAPIAPETLRGWRRLGFPIVEGYGITETAPVLTLNPPEAPRFGTVGLPISGVEIRIDAPEAEGVGEILARGPNVMKGYYGRPEATEEALCEGWYRTGDLGRFDEKGYLVVSGRKKNLIVTREGKNVYPEEVEQVVARSELVLECLVLGYRDPGDAVGERVGMLVVPDREAIARLEDAEGRRFSDEEVERRVRESIRRRLAELADYKRPRKIRLRYEEFEKTGTKKIKRYLYAVDTSG